MELKAVLVGAAAALVSPLCAGQIMLEAAGARAEATSGWELGAGYTILSAGNLRFTPGLGAFLYEGENDRYYISNNGGSPRCRDAETGQYAAGEKCDNTATRLYVRAELTYTAPSLLFGLGGRYMSGHFRPYGTVEYPVWKIINLKASAGQRYYALGAAVRF